MKQICYLDNSATTRPLNEVITRVSETMGNFFGNSSSRHAIGLESAKILRNARENISNFLCIQEGDLYFTSGGTESNNIAIYSISNLKRGRIITTAIEHISVLKSIKKLKEKGFEIVILSPNENGMISCENLIDNLSLDTVLVSIMMVNNEIGAINPVKKFSKLIQKKSPNAIFHIDAVQAFGKIDINVSEIGVDLLSFSAHKIHGPKGIGGLYASKKSKIKPIIFGGNQENGIRPGTEAIPLVAGFEEAVLRCNINQTYKEIEKINIYCCSELNKIKEIIINSPSDALPFIINFSIFGIKSEIMLNFLSERGIFISSASACSGRYKSHVLDAMKLNENQIESAIRVSFSKFNSKNDIDNLIQNIKACLISLK
ncbi:MAG: cysteine desulfurase [Oscillospiraceae bacterium]|jgi:cysteine desulfurase|nr:cysteine desulfurase [Oscillospiraceae bacterium]